MIRTVDLFCGCGGLSLGFANAGFDIVAAADYWDAAIKVYSHNITGHDVLKLDLSDAEATATRLKPFNPSVIIGGPPCQDFSSAGKRDEKLGRANLTVSFASIVEQIMPEYFVMENVDRAMTSTSLSQAKFILKKAGYGLTETVLNASYCGVPQTRKRYFLIGTLWERDNALIELLKAGQSVKPTTLRDYFGTALPFEHYYRHPRSYARRAVFSIDEPCPTVRGVNRPVPPGYTGHPGDPVDAHTLRPMTTYERGLVQTFPADFEFVGTKTDVEQMIGNAVPVKLAYYVASTLKTYIVQKSESVMRQLAK